MSRDLQAFALAAAALLLGCTDVARAASTGPVLTVNVAADRHKISPLIYGMAYPDPVLAKEIRLPINRWGGNATTRYNWQVDSTNAGDDWFFLAGGKEHPTPSAEPDERFRAAKAVGGTMLMTVPIIDYVNKATTTDGTFPVAIFGVQQKVNPYSQTMIDGKLSEMGNGRKPDGTIIEPTEEQILRIHTPNTPELQKGWIRHLVSKFGTAAKGGIPIYELDNEPDGWNNTHRDIHPGLTGHDELVKKSQIYAAAIKEVDPTAAILGPGGFLLHYQNEGAPGDGKKEHGGLGQASYYLQQMQAYHKKTGKRLLDYFDEHYYPLEQEGQSDETVLESTRSLWDPTYIEKDWYGKYFGAVHLIPSFRQWVKQYYPGTKISISEYGWGDMTKLVPTLAEIDVLGIYGRERLDLACLFGPPKATDAGANAFRLYRNYDGKGSTYGDVWVRSLSSNQSKLAVYGAERTKDHVLTLVVLNKTTTPLTSRLALSGFKPRAKAKAYRFSGDKLTALVDQPDQNVTKIGFTATYPARSATLIAIPRA